MKLENSNERIEKTYGGGLMAVGKETEEIIFTWLRETHQGREIIDCRGFRVSQRMDVDFGVETIDGVMVLAEVKSDKWISGTGNLFFEFSRINHYVANKWFYLGWGWRSPAQKLIVRNPKIKETYVFDFFSLRKTTAEYIGNMGKNTKIQIIETDKQKTTFGYLIPMEKLKYKKFSL